MKTVTGSEICVCQYVCQSVSIISAVLIIDLLLPLLWSRYAFYKQVLQKCLLVYEYFACYCTSVFIKMLKLYEL